MSKGHGVSGHTHTQQQLNHYANQHNPNNSAYWANMNNHANQLNPNNELYRGSEDHDFEIKKENYTLKVVPLKNK